MITFMHLVSGRNVMRIRWCLYWAVRFFGKGAFDGRNPKRSKGYIEQTYLDEKGKPLSYVESILKAEGFEE